jgi:hypothetical protein
MLRLPKGLLFPSLVPQNEISLKNLPGGGKTHLYTLNWLSIETIKEKTPGIGPESLVSWTTNLSYAITNQFLEEIRHCSLKAAEEWDHRHIPLIRNPATQFFAITPAIIYVLKAFHLLADCLYDSETGYFSRSDKKLVLPYALAYRFWSYQIEAKALQAYSCLKDLELYLNGLSQEPELQSFGINLLKDIQDHTNKILEMEKKQEAQTPLKPPAVKYVRGDKKGVLSDFLSNAKASAELVNKIDFTIPDVGKATLLSPKLERSAKGITLTAELSCENSGEALRKLIETHSLFTFPITDGIIKAVVQFASVKSVSSTPPPMIVFDVRRILSSSQRLINPWTGYPQESKPSVTDGLVKTINVSKIKDVCWEEQKQLEESDSNSLEDTEEMALTDLEKNCGKNSDS